MLERIARLAIAAPGKVLMVAGLLAVLLGIFGVPVADKLSPSGFQGSDGRVVAGRPPA